MDERTRRRLRLGAPHASPGHRNPRHRPAPPRWSLLVFVGALLTAVGWGLLAPRSASSKGPLVRAPVELQRQDCELGSRPRMEGFHRDAEVLVIGCATLASGQNVLVAVEPNPRGWPGSDRLACFYLAAEDQWSTQAGCRHVDPGPGPGCCPGAKSPLSGHRGVSIMSAVRPARRGPMYVAGLASADLAFVITSFRMPLGQARESTADLLPVRGSIPRRMGTAGPFAFFVGEVPTEADTCRGVAVEGRGQGGLAVDRKSVQPSDRGQPSSPLALPATRQCRGRDPLSGAIAEIVWLPLTDWRSLPLLRLVRVAEVLGVERWALTRLTGAGLLPVTRLGARTRHWAPYVAALCAIRAGCAL